MTEDAKEALELMAEGHTLDEQLVEGGHVILYGSSNSLAISYNVLRELLDAGYIEYFKTMRQGHLLFHGKVIIYSITNAGKEALRTVSKSVEPHG